MAVSLLGDRSKVMEEMRCSEADFSLYCSGQKELPFPELSRLISLIIDKQRMAIDKNREALSAIRAKRKRLYP
jgi:hypothetical protein